ncbi:MAG: hypothetical protein ACOX81_06960 [Candidatus Heteroscillospira sp.]|jgi:chromate transport protein ChrA
MEFSTGMVLLLLAASLYLLRRLRGCLPAVFVNALASGVIVFALAVVIHSVAASDSVQGLAVGVLCLYGVVEGEAWWLSSGRA